MQAFPPHPTFWGKPVVIRYDPGVKRAKFERRFDAYLEAAEKIYSIVVAIRRAMQQANDGTAPDGTGVERVAWNREVHQAVSPQLRDLARLIATRRLVITSAADQAVSRFITTTELTDFVDLKSIDWVIDAYLRVDEVLARELGIEPLSRDTLRLLK